MERKSTDVFVEMKELMDTMVVDGELWAEKGNKSAAARMRKATLALAKLGKEFRELSVTESKK